jgi:hypothetical protein
MKCVTRLLLTIATVCVCSCSHHTDEKIIGIKIYDYNGEWGKLAGKWSEMGINTAFMSASLAANDTFRQALRNRDISVFIIFPVFQNPEILKSDSSLYAITSKGLRAKDDWVEFVCPSRESYRKEKIAEIEDIVHTLNPDGISIDFIRQFVFWEMIYPGRDPASIDRACYCDSCLKKFSSISGIKIPDSCSRTVQKASWIETHCREAWNDFRCDLITSMVRELSGKARQAKPGIKINFHAVPWREEDFNGANISVAAQDLKKIAPYVDYVSPMCYSQMLMRDAGWISNVVRDMNRRAPRKILSSIQVYPYYINSPFTADEFSQCLEEALKDPSDGVVFFSWPLFERDSARMDIVSRKSGGKARMGPI